MWRRCLDHFIGCDAVLKWEDRVVDDDHRREPSPVEATVLRLAVDALPDHAFVTLDPQGVITSWNRGAERLVGWPRRTAVGAHVSSILGPGGTGKGIGPDDLRQSDVHGSLITVRSFQHHDGGLTPARATLLPLREGTQLLGYAVLAHAEQPLSADDRPRGIRHDLDDSEVSQTRRQLAESRTLLAAEIANRAEAEVSSARLLRRLVLAQEDERRRLARDLHDGLGQHLTALRLMLERFERHASSPDEQAATIASALEMLGRIDRDVDFIAWEVRPAALDDLGLVKVLDAYVKEWSRHARIPAVFHVRPANLQRVAPEVEASLYRIAQEALNNVAKHARAQSVNVLLELRGETLVLVVEDDGIGFHPTARAETMIGLAGMRERALVIGGTLEIEPTPGGGTTLLASVPAAGGYLERLRPVGAAPGEIRSGTSDRVDGSGGHEPVLSAIRTRLQDLQRAVGARDEFIATVAHELRNPIAPLTFQVRLALNKTEHLAAAGTPIPVDWIQAQLRGMEQRLHRLLETLDRLLDVSRLSTGRIDLQYESMDLADVVREVVQGFDAELAVARCKLTLSACGTPTGTWDRLRVEQVCRNLLSNAIRFGAGRPIEVIVDADQDFASLAIRDHGIGIAPEQHAKIFERFERGGEQRSGGFGIGLWIVRNICAAMGGSVSVESTLGEGACFTVLLPRHRLGQ